MALWSPLEGIWGVLYRHQRKDPTCWLTGLVKEAGFGHEGRVSSSAACNVIGFLALNAAAVDFDALTQKAKVLVTTYLASGKSGPAGDSRKVQLLQTLGGKLNTPGEDLASAQEFMKKHKVTAHKAAVTLLQPGTVESTTAATHLDFDWARASSIV